MPSNGNMKPDSRIEGRNRKNAICMAWNCVRASVDTNNPRVRLATISSIAAPYTPARLPRMGTSNSAAPSSSTTLTCTSPTAM